MTASTHSLDQALQSADIIHDRDVLDASIRAMATRLRDDYRGRRPLFLTMMNGGMIFAGQLALELGFDVELDYLHATRYRGETRGAELQWWRKPRASLAGRDVLLVDDILDEGKTLLEVGRWCRAEGCAELRVAVLALKRHDRCVEGVSADYVGVEVPDRYVFGYGMDYHEQGRNLPAIHALR